MHSCPYSSHYGCKMVFCRFVYCRLRNFCSQMLKSDLSQRGSRTFWLHHCVCCNFVPGGKWQAWIFVLWKKKYKKMSFLQACRWLFQEKQWYNIHFFCRLKYFTTAIFFLCKSSWEGVASCNWLKAGLVQPKHGCGTVLCFWKQTRYHQPCVRGLSQFIQLQMSSCLLKLLQRHLDTAVAPELPSVLLAGETSVSWPY